MNGNNRTPLPVGQLQRYNPNRPDAVEAIWQPFYDFQEYPVGGSTSLTFFAIPRGQGGKTYADTNMETAAVFPAPTSFLVMGIQVLFEPLNVASAAAAAQRVLANWLDAIAVNNAGWLELLIGGKVYLRDAPIGKFPAVHTISGVAAVAASEAAATIQTDVNYARSTGRYYSITPLLIPQNQNFSITLNFPTAVGVTVAGRIGVTLDGFYYRKSQ